MRLTPPTLTLLISTLALTPALARQDPVAGKEDHHMQTVSYSPGQVTHLSLVVGHAAAIVLPPEQNRNEAFGSDSAHLKSEIPADTNLILLKPIAPMPPKPVFIHAVLPDGSNRLYTLEIEVVPVDQASPDTAYTLKFIDDTAVSAARVAAWKAAEAKRRADAEHAAMVYAVEHPVDTNLHYVLQGEKLADWNLLPSRKVADDGTNTHFYAPSGLIYAVDADGNDAHADCSPNSVSHITTCHQLSAQWRLRDGSSVLCVFNRAYQAVPTEIPSNTVLPDVERRLRTDVP